MSLLSSWSGEQSPRLYASSVTSIYNTYLCREPANDVPILTRNGPDEYTASLRTLQRSADYFIEKDHKRAVERLQLEMGRLHMQNKQWERAARVLIPLWQTLSWRRAGWWQLLQETDWALRECVRSLQDKEILIALDWELLNQSLTPRQDYEYDFSKVLEGLQPSEARPKAVVRAESILSCISATFAFGAAEGNVGVILSSQLTLSSHAHPESTPIVISHIKVAFEGGLRETSLDHDSTKSSDSNTRDERVHLHHVVLRRASIDASTITSSPNATQNSPLVGTADLTLASGVSKVLAFDHVPRDAGNVEVASITFSLRQDDFDLEVVSTEVAQMHQEGWWAPGVSGLVQKQLKTERSTFVRILPKPPKIQIELDNLLPMYFTNEEISIDLLVANEEEDETDVTLDTRLLGPPGSLPTIAWAIDDTVIRSAGDATADDPLKRVASQLPPKYLGKMKRSGRIQRSICIQATPEPAEYLLEVTADYHVLSDPETPVSKIFSTNIVVMQPFEASYNFLPLLCSEPWPSYFDATNLDNDLDIDETGEQQASGLTQKWSLTSRLLSLADVPLIIDSLEPQAVEVHEGALCKISAAGNKRLETTLIAANDLQERDFILKVQKVDLEDRQSTFLELQLEVKWHREGSSEASTITHIAIPELVIPFGEPRVLASARNGEAPPGVIHVDYTIENPSMYTLTFNLTMETSEEFAFSGVKNVSVELVPLSRYTVRYNLMPLVKGLWITPQFRVYDTHFRKVLKVSAAEGMRNDKKGVSVWVDADD